MTRKIKDLEILINTIKTKEKCPNEITLTKLKRYIGIQFGVSSFVQQCVMKELAEFGFIETAGMNVFKINYDDKDKC